MKTVHGGLDAAELRELGLRPEQVIDFSSNINPLGTSERVRQAAAHADLSAYPDRDCLALREALSERLGVGIDHLLVGNGSTELIHLLARALLREGTTVLILGPTFGEYEAAGRLASADLQRITARESDGFSWRLESAERVIKQVRPNLVFLCNPNNPTGLYLNGEQVEQIHAAIGPEGVLVLDDAYVSFSDEPWDSIRLLQADNVAILRSMTKDHALAGIRLGYLAANPTLIVDVSRFQPAWSVNSIALAAGLAALEDQAHIDAARVVVQTSKAYLYEQLSDMGLGFTRSAANFLIVKVGDAREVRAGLLRRGVVVRDCSSFGMPEHIRVAVRRREECEQLIGALRQVLER
ncbi:MAG: histidinol-phosphate aminotransferase family protein [Chloroflexi bacterium]|nr:histidinol-phosphate aminotransferase family protein [Chloroflexota bacterium]MYJ01155.1 histidinol-phosphate aminotransferase family protein [Chloroflexota bacterium]